MVRSREVVVAQVVLHRIPLVAGIIASQFKNGAPTLSSRFWVWDHMQAYYSEIFTIIQFTRYQVWSGQRKMVWYLRISWIYMKKSMKGICSSKVAESMLQDTAIMGSNPGGCVAFYFFLRFLSFISSYSGLTHLPSRKCLGCQKSYLKVTMDTSW